MKRFFTTFLLSTGLATATTAATQFDSNGDGLVTLDEISAVYPEVTAEAFSAMDVNSDGALDADEVAAAQDAGILPQG